MKRLPWVLLLICAGVITLLAILAIVLIDWKSDSTKQHQNTAQNLLDEQVEKACGLRSSESVAAQEKVSLRANGFEPKEVTIKVGQTVRWTNNDSGQRQVVSDVHPIHDNCFGLDSEAMESGDSFGFTFTKPGSWSYHDESALSNTGVVVVTE